MSTETMERPAAAAPVVALTPPQRAAVALNTAEYEIKLRELLTNSVAILAVTNKAGRDECHAAYMVLKNARCSITNLSEDATEDAKAFTKAVKAEAVRLIAITTAEEDRLEGLRDDWDEAEKARKAALIAAEKARTDAIQAAIQAIRDIPLAMIGKSAQDISRCIAGLVGTVPDEFYQEFIEQANVARHEALDKLAAAETAQRGIEIGAESQRQEAARVAAEAEEARKAAEKRAADEAAAVAAQRVENERVANELAIAAKRLADQEAAQALVAKQLADKAAANLKADRDAQELHMRIEREKIAAEQAKALAEIKAARDRLDAELAAQAAAIKLEADHPQALLDNAQFDVDREAERVRKQAMADQHLIDKRNLPPPESYCERDEQADAGISEDPSDEEIIEQIAESFRMTFSEALDRVSVIAFAELRAELVAA